MALLEVKDLKVHFKTDDGIVKAVDGVSYSLDRGRALGIVGESGSGKSVSSLTVMGLTRFAGNAEISGSITFDGEELLTASDEDMRRLRGNEIAMIFQDPLSSLHPFYRIGDQLVEAVRAHRDEVSKAQARDRAIEMLGLVGIPEPRRRVDAYPHEFSGGMRQRVMIAMALINDPKLLIADEPTTALDVTVQAQILDLIERLQRELDTAIVMITHDLGVVAEVADDIAVMYAGRIVEHADKETIFVAPRAPVHLGPAALDPAPRPRARRAARADPRTAAVADPQAAGLRLPSALPVRARGAQEDRPAARGNRGRRSRRRDRPPGRLPAARPDAPRAVGRAPAGRHARAGEGHGHRARGGRRHGGGPMSAANGGGTPLIEVRDLVKHFPLKKGIILQREYGAVRAVDGIDFDVKEGETLGLVGESGCGKSTTARLITRLLEPTSRRRSATAARTSPPLAARPQAAAARHADDLPGPVLVAEPAQDGRLDHRRAVRHPRHRARRGQAPARRVQELMDIVGLNPEHYNRFPHEFSGGQRQRIGVARAIALKPKLVVADEPVSALDVSIQAQIINLLRELQRELGLTIIFIAHDLSVVRHVCDRIAVMYLGKIVELADADQLFDHPRHPYTGALLSAVPVPDPRLAREKQRQMLGGDVPSPTNPPAGVPLPHALSEGARRALQRRGAAARGQGGRQPRRVPLPADRRGDRPAGADRGGVRRSPRSPRRSPR